MLMEICIISGKSEREKEAKGEQQIFNQNQLPCLARWGEIWKFWKFDAC